MVTVQGDGVGVEEWVDAIKRDRVRAGTACARRHSASALSARRDGWSVHVEGGVADGGGGARRIRKVAPRSHYETQRALFTYVEAVRCSVHGWQLVRSIRLRARAGRTAKVGVGGINGDVVSGGGSDSESVQVAVVEPFKGRMRVMQSAVGSRVAVALPRRGRIARRRMRSSTSEAA